MPSSAKQIFANLVSSLVADVEGDGLGLVSNALVSIQANPSVANVVAQGAALAVTAPLVLPNLEAQAAKDIAGAGLALIGLLPPTPKPA